MCIDNIVKVSVYNGEPEFSRIAGDYRHLGIYAYTMQGLREFYSSFPFEDEVEQCLEQLRAVHLGMTIHVARARYPHGRDIDIEEDLQNEIS